MFYPYPNIWGASRRRFIGAICEASPDLDTSDHGYVAGVAPLTPPFSFYAPGGLLEPSDVGGATIVVIKNQINPGPVFLFGVAGTGRPANFFEGLIAPGINGGAPLLTANATRDDITFVGPMTLWRWYDLPSGLLVDGDFWIW